MPSAQQGLFISDPAQLGADTVGASEIAANSVGDSEVAAHTTTKITTPFSLVTGTVPVAQGGTGQTSQTAAFDALSPTTTQGDIIYYNGVDNVRLGAGNSGQFLQTQGPGANPQWASGGNTHLNRNFTSRTISTDPFTLLTGTIAANTMGANGLIRGRMVLTEGAGVGSRVEIQWGGSTILTIDHDIGAFGEIYFEIANRGATNSQFLHAFWHQDGNAGTGGESDQQRGTAAVDTTANVTLTIRHTGSTDGTVELIYYEIVTAA